MGTQNNELGTEMNCCLYPVVEGDPVYPCFLIPDL
jgi:hypothetical protein